MNQLRISRLIELLERQEAGDAESLRKIRALEVSPDDGLCFWQLHQEWLGAFSYTPGRLEALAPILSLARKLRAGKLDAQSFFRTRDWQSLLKLRGPVESVQFRRCEACGHEHPVMATSGLYDACGLVCGDCGNVYFRAYDDRSPLPRCACGSRFPAEPEPGCPDCGQAFDYDPIAEISPYQYFAGHRFRRGPAA